MGLDLQRNAQMRLDILLVMLVIWILLLPVGYFLLSKAAHADIDGAVGCFGGIFGIPESRIEARERLKNVHIAIAVVVALIVFIVIASSQSR